MKNVAAVTERDAAYMRRTFTLARLGWGHAAPNPLVGAVIVSNEEIVGEGYHAEFGEAHAETLALQAAQERALGATLYVNLEPCAHHGKTPPCADAVINGGIARVVIGTRDPSDVARGGLMRLRDAGVHVDVGIERDAALELNAPFFNAHARDRPWVTLKLAVSADGAITDPTLATRWITSAESRLETHRQRANVDAIAVGVGTVLSDDPALTVRGVAPPRLPPRRVVFDSNLRTPLQARLVRTARDVDTIIVGAPDAGRTLLASVFAAAGVRVLASSSLSDALVQLRGEGIRSLYVEGGARLAGSLLRESLVDRLIIFRSPIALGRSALKAFTFAPTDFESSLAHRRVVERGRFGADVMTIYALEDVPCSPA